MLFTEFLTNVAGAYLSAMMTIIPSLLADDVSTGKGLKLMGAGLAGIGLLGSGIGQGNVGQGACLAIGRNPEMAPKITSTMIIAAGIAESGAIYALVIAILLIFVA